MNPTFWKIKQAFSVYETNAEENATARKSDLFRRNIYKESFSSSLCQALVHLFVHTISFWNLDPFLLPGLQISNVK